MHILFDLDGTLTDSRTGIARCLEHALAELGVACPSAEMLTAQVGPPLAMAFASLLQTSDSVQIDTAIALFRQRFERVGMFENALYPRVAETLSELTEMRFTKCVVTAKPHLYAKRILAHFGVAQYFSSVYGPELSDRTYSKGDLIRQACVDHGILPGEGVMVGDRVEDIVGGKANGLRTVAALWGYGDHAELESARPDHRVRTSPELVAWLRELLVTNSNP